MANLSMNGLGGRIAALRRARGMTQEELASRLSITPQAISKWERDAGLPDLVLFPALAEALGVSVGELFGEASVSEAVLPERFEGLPLVAQRGGLGCYSDKKVKESDERGVDFEDGSRVEWSSRTVINRGAGEVRLAEEERVAQTHYDERKTDYDEVVGAFHSLEINNSLCCAISIVASADGVSRVRAKGSPRFIAMIETAVADDTLRLHIKSPEGGGERGGNNTMTVEVGFERGERLKATINGSGSLETVLPFGSGELVVNGSGDIVVGDLGSLTAQINGSGDVRLGDVAGETRLNVNGAGDIGGGRLGKPLHIGVNGSGDVKGKSAADVSVRIAGAGDVVLDRVDERLSVNVTGSGDIRCGGEVAQLSLGITGSGELHAKELTAQEAEIHLTGSSSVHIGRIVGCSTERVGKTAKLRVDRRG